MKGEKVKRIICGFVGAVWGAFCCELAAHATWTALITADDFTGIKTDMGTAATGMLSVILIVLGLGILVRVIGGLR